MKRAILCAALGATLAASAATAAGAEDGQMRVALGDLNMATPEGAHVALARIEFSAADFCDANSGRQSLERSRYVDRCVADMTRKSVSQLHAPLVTALLDGQAPQARSVTLAQK
jgi:UrcA family protein